MGLQVPDRAGPIIEERTWVQKENAVAKNKTYCNYNNTCSGLKTILKGCNYTKENNWGV